MKKNNIMNTILLSLVATSMVACGGSKSSQKKAGSEQPPVVEPQEKVDAEKDSQHPAFSASKEESQLRVTSLNEVIRKAKKSIEENKHEVEVFVEKNKSTLNKSEGMEESKIASAELKKHEEYIISQEQAIKEATRVRDMYSIRINIIDNNEKLAFSKEALMQAHRDGNKKGEREYDKSISDSLALKEAYNEKMEKLNDPVAYVGKLERKLTDAKKKLAQVQQTQEHGSSDEVSLEFTIGELSAKIDNAKADIGE